MKKDKLAPALLLIVSSAVSPALAEDEAEKVGESRQPAAVKTVDDGGRLFGFFGWTMTGAAIADLASTEWGLKQPGLEEKNPLMGNRAVRVSVHAVTPVAVWWVTERMQRHGRPKLALFVRIGVTAVYGYATVNNLRAVTTNRVR